VRGPVDIVVYRIFRQTTSFLTWLVSNPQGFPDGSRRS
jgi:hypothetical protein